MESVDVELPDLGPLSWATKSGSHLYTAIVPIRSTGEIITGSIEDQAFVVFDNLRTIMVAAGGSLQDVVQVIIYLLDIQDAPKMTEVWKTVFVAPYPNRATIGVQGLTIPGVRIEIVATAILSPTVMEHRP